MKQYNEMMIIKIKTSHTFKRLDKLIQNNIHYIENSDSNIFDEFKSKLDSSILKGNYG